jgi:hypothetical protein
MAHTHLRGCCSLAGGTFAGTFTPAVPPEQFDSSTLAFLPMTGQLNDSVEGYFQAGGKLIAYWANPGSMADDTAWDDNKSICYRDLKVEKVDPTKKLPVIGPDDCKLIELGAKKP